MFLAGNISLLLSINGDTDLQMYANRDPQMSIFVYIYLYCKVNWNNENCFNFFLTRWLCLFSALDLVSLLIFLHAFRELSSSQTHIHSHCTRVLFYAQWLPWWTLCVRYRIDIVISLGKEHKLGYPVVGVCATSNFLFEAKSSDKTDNDSLLNGLSRR